MFEEIKSLRPHFHSLREIQNNVSLDIKVPLSWKYEDIVKPYRTVTLKVQDKNDTFNLVSFISQATQEGYDVSYASITLHRRRECRCFTGRDKRLSIINSVNSAGKSE